MSTVSEIEAALPKLSADELRQVAASVRRAQGQQDGRAPWMELAGCLAGEREELQRIEQTIREEFEQVKPDDWR